MSFWESRLELWGAGDLAATSCPGGRVNSAPEPNAHRLACRANLQCTGPLHLWRRRRFWLWRLELLWKEVGLLADGLRQSLAEPHRRGP